MPHIPCSDEGRLRTVLYEGSADVMFEALTEQLAENCSWMIPWTFCNSRLPYRLGKDRVGFAERLLVSILQSNAVTRPVNIFSETTFLLAFSCSQGLSALLVVSPNSPHSTYDVTIMSTVSWVCTGKLAFGENRCHRPGFWYRKSRVICLRRVTMGVYVLVDRIRQTLF